MCDWHSSHLTLRGEFGIWDARTRFDLLLLFLCSRLSTLSRTLSQCWFFDSRPEHQALLPETGTRVAYTTSRGFNRSSPLLHAFVLPSHSMTFSALILPRCAWVLLVYEFSRPTAIAPLCFQWLPIKAFEVAALSPRADLGQLQLGLFDVHEAQQWCPLAPTFQKISLCRRRCMTPPSLFWIASAVSACCRLRALTALPPALRLKFRATSPSRTVTICAQRCISVCHRAFYLLRVNVQHNE